MTASGIKLSKGSRNLAFRLHRLLGSLAAIYILLMSLSGAALVFHDEIEAAFCTPVIDNPAAETVSFSKLIGSVEEQFPGYRAAWIHNKKDPRDYKAIYAQKGAERITVLVDGGNARVYGRLNPLLETLKNFHFDLLNAGPGRQWQGVGAIVLLFVGLSGVILGAPYIKIMLKGNSFPNQVKTWHALLGLLIAPLILNWSVSALSLAYPEQFKGALAKAIGNDAAPVVLARVSGQSLSTDRLAEFIYENFPGEHLLWMKLPAFNSGKYKLVLQREGNPPVKRTLVMDETSGILIEVSSDDRATTADFILGWLKKLHFGNFAGVWSKSIWVLLALIPGSLAISGLYMWWLNRRRRDLSDHGRIS
ncbi:hypothetical protein GC174_09660 [bacterium]|nr:hypothetical protein [bacterium]